MCTHSVGAVAGSATVRRRACAGYPTTMMVGIKLNAIAQGFALGREPEAENPEKAIQSQAALTDPCESLFWQQANRRFATILAGG